jgi:hypothetical protein
MKKIIVISNMYPSKTDPVYGTFVKGFVDGLAEGYILDITNIFQGKQ